MLFEEKLVIVCYVDDCDGCFCYNEFLCLV